ncbi:MAG: TetR family transcriptional regulator [Solirubrobacterales bacterium]|nr:TetR family transcriptional regulator [Solirubrobacterales bacterium]
MSRWKPDAQGRLIKAAIELFAEQGYDATTVAEIAERAGLTKRTFFRYFTDKREVLFFGSEELERIWLEALATTPTDASPLAAVMAGFDPIAEMFEERLAFARLRAGIIMANPELQERELIKLQRLAGSIKAALLERGVPLNAAILAAQTGLTVFHVAFARWVAQDDPAALRRLIDESLDDLRKVTAAEPAATRARL